VTFVVIGFYLFNSPWTGPRFQFLIKFLSRDGVVILAKNNHPGPKPDLFLFLEFSSGHPSLKKGGEIIE
jgi:hypothetical protein